MAESASAPRRPARLRCGWQALARPAALARAAWLVPLGFALLALLLGQDDNWDLRNYHLYNPFALLNGKVGLDLAPAQWQSYFNPTLDLLYYGLIKTLPAPLAGAVMGLLHGLNFVLLLALARQLLRPGAPGGERPALLLALAGCLGAGFLSELGNSMGDNLSALPVLAALLLIVRHWDALADGRALAPLVSAGLLTGAAAGLKLTNAVYPLAACLALLTLPAAVPARLRAAAVFALAVLAGLAASGGHWWWSMWQCFGNPLFPQYNDIFHGPLAAPIGQGDNNWLPRSWGERLLWPFVFTLQPQRVSELRLTLLIWPLLYLGFWALGLARLAARWRAPAGRPPPLPGPERFLLLFMALAYLAWLLLFAIYRYLIPLELLAPLACWLIVRRLTAAPAWRRGGAWLLLLAVLAGMASGHWGRARWHREAFRVATPALARPQHSVVLLVQAPIGWLAAGFPPQVAFATLGSGIFDTPAYRARVAALLAGRDGPHYLLLTADLAPPGRLRSPAQRDAAAAANRLLLQGAGRTLAAHGLRFDAAACRSYPAYIGATAAPYQLCPLLR